MGRLEHRRGIVTGAAGGIGQAVGRLFAAEGANLFLIDQDIDGVSKLALDIRKAVPRREIIGRTGDVADDGACEVLVNEAATQLGGLDFIVCCAVTRTYSPLAEVLPDSWDNILRVNLLGVQNIIKNALPFLHQSDAASIIILSSVFADVGRVGMGQYDATKAALLSLARTFAAEEAAHGVRVNTVCPGSTWTNYTASRAKARGMTQAELRDKGAAPNLLNRWAEPEEIAYPILWLASEEASYITGISLVVDGGLSNVR